MANVIIDTQPPVISVSFNPADPDTHNDNINVDMLIDIVKDLLTNPLPTPRYVPPFLSGPPYVGGPLVPFEPWPPWPELPVEGRYWFNTGAMGIGDPGLWVQLSGTATDPPRDDGATVSAGFAVNPPVAPRSGKTVIRQHESGTSPQSFRNLIAGGASVFYCGDEFAETIDWTLDFVPAREGVYNVRIVAEDRAGNVSDPMISPLRFTWDKTPPKTEITYGCVAELKDKQVTFHYQLADEGGGRFSYVLERYQQNEQNPTGGTIDQTSGFTAFSLEQSTVPPLFSLEPGRTYRFGVLATDMAGNVDTTFRTEPPLNLCVFNVVERGEPIDTVITDRPPAVIEAVYYVDSDGQMQTDVPPISVSFRSRPLFVDTQFEYTLERDEGMLLDSGVLDTSGFDTYVLSESLVNGSILILGRPVTCTFRVRALHDIDGSGVWDSGEPRDATPATCSFVVRPRHIPRGPEGQPQPGLEDEVFTDPTPGQPFKYFREEPG